MRVWVLNVPLYTVKIPRSMKMLMLIYKNIYIDVSICTKVIFIFSVTIWLLKQILATQVASFPLFFFVSLFSVLGTVKAFPHA